MCSATFIYYRMSWQCCVNINTHDGIDKVTYVAQDWEYFGVHSHNWPCRLILQSLGNVMDW